jgi:hypothetical protein
MTNIMLSGSVLFFFSQPIDYDIDDNNDDSKGAIETTALYRP